MYEECLQVPCDHAPASTQVAEAQREVAEPMIVPLTIPEVSPDVDPGNADGPSGKSPTASAAPQGTQLLVTDRTVPLPCSVSPEEWQLLLC